MSVLYGYATGSNYESKRYSTIDELLTQIPNNASNLVSSEDVRDSVFTLWERITEVSYIAGSAASASAFFQNPNPTTVAVGGVAVGTTFSTPKSMQQMFDMIFYPYTTPTSSLGAISSREYGASTNVTLTWNVVKNSNNIVSITVDGALQTTTGQSQSGTKLASGTYSVTPPVSTVNTFNMSVYDGNSTTTTSTTLTWLNRIYWGKVNLSSLATPNPNLTTNPGATSLVSSYITNTIINALNGAGVSPGSQLSATKARTYTGINGAGEYLIFAWPTNTPGANTPSFIVNGLPSTAFTRIKTNWAFTNQLGFSGTNYEVWISNTLQNSPLNITIS